MSRFFKTLKPYWKSVLLIIALLVLQAYADLSLPQYTSDIIDTGIQNGGFHTVCRRQSQRKNLNWQRFL